MKWGTSRLSPHLSSFPVSRARFVVAHARVNNRFLTGPSALFGMTKLFFDALYAALKRRSFTVALAAVEGPTSSQQGQSQKQRTRVSAPHAPVPGFTAESSDSTAPLKPKSGLNGPPSAFRRALRSLNPGTLIQPQREGYDDASCAPGELAFRW